MAAISISEQLRNLPILATPEHCRDGIYIVTGSNIGIGFETAKHLVRLEAKRVILAVRNLEAGEVARRQIEEETGRSGVAEVWRLDLASYDSVKDFAQRAILELDKIDGLIENAAAALEHWTESEGMETSVVVNVLGTFLLAVLLLPKMIGDARSFGILPHLVIVTSGAGFDQQEAFNKIKDNILGGLNKKEEAAMASASRYFLTKLMQILMTLRLAELMPVELTGVVINLLSPGLVRSGLLRQATLATRIQVGLMSRLLGRTSEMGSRTVLHAVFAGKQSHGGFLTSCEITNGLVPGWITDTEGINMQKRLWAEVTAKLEQVQPGCIAKLLQF
ncbi:putative short-chain dehydrogenase/reductase family protein [Xylariales sp. PMI_506]|nr:putative short-chain dehydrogenase/reductase family protein [Xylariales sp. PMI_506]